MSQSLFALSFSSPWLLAWMVAIGIPILIHLWSRRQYEEVDWAAMRFLQQAIKQNSRRITLEHLLLLLIRSLILVLLAFAIAGPFLDGNKPDNGAVSRAPRTHHILVIDGSWSMGRGASMGSVSSAGSNWQNALDELRRTVRSAPADDAFTLIQMGSPAELIIREPAFDRSIVAREIDALQLSHSVADLAATVDAVEQCLGGQTRSQTKFDRTLVSFLTDLEENTWASANEPVLREKIGRIAERASIEIREIGGAAEPNVAVLSVSYSPGRLLPDHPASIHTRLQSFAATDDRQVVARLHIDGEQTASRTVSLSPGQPMSVRFPARFQFVGDHRVEVSIDDDSLTLDDRRYAVLPVQPSIRVLCAGDRKGEADNVRWALQPGQAATRSDSRRSRSDRAATGQIEAQIETRSISFSALAEQNLDSFDAIVLCNVSKFGSDDAARLHQFVNSGGALLIFMGDAARLDNYNRRLFDDGNLRLLPGRLVGRSEYAEHLLDPLRYQHPIVQVFRGLPRSGLLTTPIWKYLSMSMDPDSSTATALAFQNGDPAIAVREVGAGRVVCFTSSASASSVERTAEETLPWSQFHTWPSFVAIVHEMLQFGIGEGSRSGQVKVGDLLTGNVPARITASRLQMTAPDDSTMVVRQNSSTGKSTGKSQRKSTSNTDNGPVPSGSARPRRRWNAGPVRRVGIYSLKELNSENPHQYFAVNVDHSESRASRLSLGELPNQYRSVPDSPEIIATPQGVESAPLFRNLLIGLFVLLIVESFLAGWFGRGNAKSTL